MQTDREAKIAVGLLLVVAVVESSWYMLVVNAQSPGVLACQVIFAGLGLGILSGSIAKGRQVNVLNASGRALLPAAGVLSLNLAAGTIAWATDFHTVALLFLLLVLNISALFVQRRSNLLVLLGGHLGFAALGPLLVQQAAQPSPFIFLITLCFAIVAYLNNRSRLRNRMDREIVEHELEATLDRLELDVRERTRDLQLTNDMLLREVSSRVRAERFLYARGRILEHLTSGGTIDVILRQVLITIEDAGEAMVPAIMRLDPEGDCLRAAAGPGLPDYFLNAVDGLPIAADAPLCGSAAYSRRPAIVSDFLSDENCAELRSVTEQAGLRACCSVPLLAANGDLLGTLAVYFLRPRQADPAEMEFVRNAAQHIAAAIERDRTQTALEQSRMRYRLATEAANLGIWDFDLDSHELYMDPVMRGMLGYSDTDDTLLQLGDILEVLSSREYHRGLRQVSRYLRQPSEALMLEHRVRRRDGREIWLAVRGAAVRGECGRPLRLLGTCLDVTEIRTAERALLDNEAKFRSLSEAAFEGLLMLSGSRVIDANEKFCEMFGWELNEISGRDISDFVMPDCAAELNSCLQSLDCGVLESRARDRSGGSFPVEINASRYVQAGEERCVVAFRDLTLRQTLERVTLQLGRFIQNASGPIFCVNSTGQVVEWNEAIARLTGISRGMMLGKRMIDTCVASNERKAVQRILNRVRDGDSVSNFEFSLVGSDGRRARVLMNASAGADHRTTSPTVWCVGQDITELSEYRSVLEQKVVERTQDLITALDKEKELSDLRSRFVSMASHEFRTPLATIQATADLMIMHSDRLDREQSADYLASVLSEVRHMTDLLDDILIFGKGEAGKLIFRPAAIDVHGLAEELIAKYERMAGNANRFRYECKLEMQPILDEKLVRLILSNLISNALKYSPPEAPIEISLRSLAGGTRLEVIDQGIGIAEEDQADLFQPFHRGVNVGNRSGTGLGLAILKMAVEMHSGTIELDTRTNRGTRITVFLPHGTEKPPVQLLARGA